MSQGSEKLPCWFVVLPDCASAAIIGYELRDRTRQQVSHPSGRPWLLGCWPDDSLVIGQSGRTKIAVIGEHAVSTSELASAANQVKTVAELDGLTGLLIGSVHLAASVDGRVRVQGTVTGLRRVSTPAWSCHRGCRPRRRAG